MRVTAEEEDAGLDISEHGMYGYPEQFIPQAELGGYGLALMGTFLLILVVPFAYLLSVGALDWGPVRQVTGRVLGPILRTTTVPSGIPSAEDVEPSEEAA